MLACVALLAVHKGEAAATTGMDIYVLGAPPGNDTNDGLTPDKPLRTLSQAQEAARQLAHTGHSDWAAHVTIHVGGVFELGESLALWKFDSNTTWRGWSEQGNGTLSGGYAVPDDAWGPCEGVNATVGPWCADLPPGVPSNASSIFERSAGAHDDVRRRYLARTKMLHWESTLPGALALRGFVYADGDIPKTWNVTPAALRSWRAVGFHQWTKSYHTVHSVDRASRTILFGEDAPYKYGAFVNNTASERRWYIERVPELVLAPECSQFQIVPGGGGGERSVLRFAAVGGKPAGGAVIVPRLHQLVKAQHATDVVFEGLTFAHTDLACPRHMPTSTPTSTPALATGASTGTAAYPTCDQSDSSALGQLLAGLDLTRLLVANCTFVGSGGDAVLIKSSLAPRVSRCTVLEAGGAGVTLDTCTGNATVEQSRVRGAGGIVTNAPGLWASRSVGAIITRCEVCNVSHVRGIRWDSADDSGAWTQISLNHIHHCGCAGEDCLCDGGGLDGASYNARKPVFLRQNYVHHIQARNFGGAGVYNDVSSTGVQVEQNVVHTCGNQPFYWNVQPGGLHPLARDAEPTRVTGNLFVKDFLDGHAQAPWVNGTSVIDWKGYTPAVFRANVVASLLPRDAPRHPKLIGGTSCGAEFKVDNATCVRDLVANFAGSDWDSNLYWNCSDPSGEATLFPAPRATGGGATLAGWQATGHDQYSSLADPRFVDPAAGDYRLRPDSPAFALGYAAWDWSSAGPNW